MKNIIKNLLTVLLVLVLIFSNTIHTMAQSEIVVKLNGKNIAFPDVKPYMDTVANRVLVPVRFVAESLGADVKWDNNKKSVSIVKGTTRIELKLGEKKFSLNGDVKQMDTVAFIKYDRTFVPIRFISEALGVNVGWDQSTYTALLNDIENSKEFVMQGIALGSTEKKLIEKLGQPARKDLSQYGFEWYIYNSDYSKYIQVGVKNGSVVALYTNADNWKSSKGIKIGLEKKKVEEKLGEPIKSILKGNVNYSIMNTNEKGVYLVDNSYVTIFYDIHNNNTVTSIQIIDKDTEQGLHGYYGEYSQKLRDSFEKQVFDLANSIRVRNQMKPFSWNDKAMLSSRKHSQDMADNNYFDHNNLKGKTPFKRMEDEGISYSAAGENIAAGLPSSIEAHEGWMNSIGHRKNILGNFKNLGVGVGHNSSSIYRYYYTQNFFTGN